MERDPRSSAGYSCQNLHPWYMVVWDSFGQNVWKTQIFKAIAMSSQLHLGDYTVDRTEIENLFRSISVWKRGHERAPHKPAAPLLAQEVRSARLRRMIAFYRRRRGSAGVTH